MVYANVCIVLYGSSRLPRNLCNNIILSKYFIANFSKVLHLIVINGNKYHTIIREQISCNLQSRVNHVEPIGMESTIAFGIGKHTIALLVKLS